MVDGTEVEFIKAAIAEARKCKSEENKVTPLVGALAVRDGKIIAAAYRGELTSGEHAEYTLLERKLKGETLAGTSIYTTLEPCTSRNSPKIPCVERLIARKVNRVVIGTLDPNPIITGRGQLALRSANITTDLFPDDLMAEVEELNRDFIRVHRDPDLRTEVNPRFIEKNQKRHLDDWYVSLNSIYWNRNFFRDGVSIFAHLVEVTGGLSLLASGKKKIGVDPERYVVKAIAWWLALCGKLGVKSVEQLIWNKFPGVCPYCQHPKHDPDECSEKKAANPGPPWQLLGEIGNDKERPADLSEWQLMFSSIYPAQQTEDYGPSFARLYEELAELAEAVRVFPAQPGYFLSEAADVFAWLMHIQNLIEQKKGVLKKDRGKALGIAVCHAYPDCCRDCGLSMCGCPPILQSTIGRIVHEVPTGFASYGETGQFMTPDKARARFLF
jgi:pyrimidine deaminase RibD-like protein